MYFASDIPGYFFGNIQAPNMGLFLHYGHSCLVARRIDPGNQAPVESANEAFLERWNLAGSAIGAENNLFAVVVKGIKRMEEFLLAIFTFPQELNIVDYQ